MQNEKGLVLSKMKFEAQWIYIEAITSVDMVLLALMPLQKLSMDVPLSKMKMALLSQRCSRPGTHEDYFRLLKIEPCFCLCLIQAQH